jgi:recombination protein RecA
MKLGDRTHLEVSVIPTGSLALDLALGVGGFPRGRITEIYGPEASGKTTLCLHVIAEAQKAGGTAAFIDAEHALDPQRAETIGVKLDDLLISQPDTGEQALEIAETLIRSGAVDVICIDSVAALVPKAEIEGEMGDSVMGLQARLMSQAMRKLTSAIAKSKAVVIFTNQLRMKIGVMFGNPETTPGGKALKFYASIRLDCRKIANIQDGDKIVGSRHRIKVVKNKVAPPFAVAELDILNVGGISRLGDLIDLAQTHGVLEKSGSFFRFKGAVIGQGKEAVRQYLSENSKLAKEIETSLWQKIKTDDKQEKQPRGRPRKTAESGH